MFKKETFEKLLIQYIYGILGWLMLGCTGVCFITAVFMFVGAMGGMWSFIHILAMLGMTAGFAILAAIFVALHTAAGGWFFGKEDS